MKKALPTCRQSWLIIIGIAFVIRVAFALIYSATPTDGAAAYDALSSTAMSGQGYVNFSARALYIYYTKMMYFFFGPNQMMVIMGNIIMGTVTVWIVGKVSLLILSKPDYAIFPMIMTALNPVFIFWVGYTFPETMFLLFLILAILAGHRIIQKPSWGLAATYGILLILLLFIRAHGLVLAPLMGLWLIWAVNKDKLSHWMFQNKKNKIFSRIFLLIALFFISSLILITIKNIHMSPQDRIWPFTLLMGNHPAQNDFHKRLVGPEWGEITRMENLPYILEDVSSVREHIRVATVKVIRFWYPIRPQFSLKHKLILSVIYGALSVLSIIGFVQLWKTRSPALYLFLTVFIAFTIVTIINFPDEEGRYRLPCDLLLILIAGEPVGLLWDRMRG